MAEEIRRQIAYKTSIMQILNGIFVKKQGWESNYIMTEYGDFSRVNIIAVVVSKDENSITLDDGTGQINARFFDNQSRLDGINVGDVVLTVSRPREYNNSKYLTLEIIKTIRNKTWVSYRKKELQLIKKIRDMENVKQSMPVSEPITTEYESTLTSKDKIMKLIEQLDTGSGASIDDVITLSKLSNSEDIITDLVMKGEIFELRPGRLKKI